MIRREKRCFQPIENSKYEYLMPPSMSSPPSFVYDPAHALLLALPNILTTASLGYLSTKEFAVPSG